MENIEQYRMIISRIINEHAAVKPSVGEIETEIVLDTVNDHYELVLTGWVKQRRVHGAVIHVDIRGGKVWIQHDGTEDGIADDLLEAGIPKEKIVLGFKPPDMRVHTGFAVA